MKSHFTLSNRIVEFTPPSVTKPNRGNQVKIGSRAALALAVSGASVMLTGACYGQAALDVATGSTYSGGWSAGQNGGYGFGAWSFDGTTSPGGVANPGAQQGLSSGSAIGTAWTMYNLGNVNTGGTGISDVGRAINAGLRPGQTFTAVLQNPTAYHFYGGYDICFGNATDNYLAGDNSAAIRVGVFNYFGNNWSGTSLSASTTGAAGMDLSLTIFSSTAYGVTLTPLSNPSAAQSFYGTYSGPLNYVNFREYDGTSTSSPTDVANNIEISSMSVSVVPEPANFAVLSGLGATGLLFFRRRK
jgi:hypothetical protein